MICGPERDLRRRLTTDMIRIIAGEYRSRELLVPPDAEVTRPYTQRVRESVFNLLRGWFEDARVLDVFAGVGSMGLEAASRGAAEVVLIERDRKIADLAQSNIDRLGCADRVRVARVDALGPGAIASAPQPVDVVFVDPPYPMMRDEAQRERVLEQVARLRTVMAESSFLVLRTPMGGHRADLLIDGFVGPEEHEYSAGMWVMLYQPDRGQDQDQNQDSDQDLDAGAS